MNTLSWDNYLILVDLRNNNDYVEKWLSPISLVTYQYYGIDVKYHITPNNEIILYNRFNEKYAIKERINNKWLLSQVYYFKDSNINELKKIIESDLITLNQDPSIIFFNVSIEMVNDFGFQSQDYIEEQYVSNYIYLLEQLKTFAGKKMQKKRNHLNAFINTINQSSLTFIDIKQCDYQQIYDYLLHHMKKYDESHRQHEIDIYIEFLKNQMSLSDKFSGLVIKLDDQIIGLTLCYLHTNIYEIILEKAEIDIRGSYQFLIKSNLEFNNINCEYIDRQDDGGLDYLAKSKHSYHPILEVKRYSQF